MDLPLCKNEIMAMKRLTQFNADMFASIVREKYFSDTQVMAHYDFLSKNLKMPLLVHEMPFLSGYDASILKWPMSL